MALAVRNRIQTLRKEQGLTIRQLAALTAISRSTLSRMELGHQRLTDLQLAQLAQALNVPLQHLLEIVTESPRPEIAS